MLDGQAVKIQVSDKPIEKRLHTDPRTRQMLFLEYCGVI
jgi:hypothetical protein